MSAALQTSFELDWRLAQNQRWHHTMLHGIFFCELGAITNVPTRDET